MEAYRVVEQVARDSRGRLLAFLASRSRDIAAAEDALADAFHSALEAWVENGVPDRPEAWLLTAARRRIIDGIRHARVHAEAMPDLVEAAEEAQKRMDAGPYFPDERLKLLFICAHPAIAVAARTPLMLQTVLGLDAARIASAFLVSPSAMGQRLSRAKTKIREARIAFEVPEAKELPPRTLAVLETIYAAYGTGWEDVTGADPRIKGLATEAIELGRLLSGLMPEEPEVHGLVALMLYCEARRDTRRGIGGAFVPLSEQDTARWSKPMMEEAERLLSAAARGGRIGPFQVEAAIQSAHAQRARSGRTDWEAVALLYEALVHMAPTLGALVARAAATAEARGAADGWAMLEAIPAEAVTSYQPYWAVAAHLLRRLGRFGEASSAYSRAMGLCEDPALRAFLGEQAQIPLN